MPSPTPVIELKTLIQQLELTDPTSFLGLNNDGELAKGTGGGSGIATIIEADYCATTNLHIINPNLSGSGNLVVDTNTVLHGDVVFMPNQINKAENGSWTYDQINWRFVRNDDMPSGGIIQKPFQVSITGDDGDNAGKTFELSSPPTVIVDETLSSWNEATSGAGILAANTAIMGPYNPISSPRVGTARGFTPLDIGAYDVSSKDNTFPQHVYANLNNFGYVSRFLEPAAPHSNRNAIQNCMARWDTVIFDCAVYLLGQITASLSGKRFIFCASGNAGPLSVFMDSNTSSFLDLSAAHDFKTEGHLVIEYLSRANTGIKAIKGTTFGNVKIQSLYTKGVDYACNFSGTITGLNIGTIEVGDLSTDTPLFIASASAASSLKTKVGQIIGIPSAQTLSTGLDVTIKAFINSPLVKLGGAMPANQTATLSLENVAEGYEQTVIHAATGGHTYDVGPGLKTISNGGIAVARVSNGAWILVS